MANTTGSGTAPISTANPTQQAQTVSQPASPTVQFTCTSIQRSPSETVTTALQLDCRPSQAPPKQDSLPQSIILSGLVILTATASIVSVSVSRQEALSGRTRTLSGELRQLAILKDTDLTFVARNRLLNIPRQLVAFRLRLQKAVWAHVILYVALAIEALGFGIGFLAAALRELRHPAFELGVIYVAPAFFILVLLLLSAGLSLHIVEYHTSNKTMDMELEDIFGYAKGHEVQSSAQPASIEKEYEKTIDYAKQIRASVHGFALEVQKSRKASDALNIPQQEDPTVPSTSK